MRLRSTAYLEWIRSLRCASCDSFPPSEAHHIKGIGHFSGAGLRASDHLAMPLCGQCHRRLHDGRIGKEVQWEWLARTLADFVEAMPEECREEAVRTMTGIL